MRIQITATVHVVTRHRTVGGVTMRRHDIPTGHALPWLIAARAGCARGIGINYVRSIGDDGDVVAVTVSDGGRRALASWRRMDYLSGLTGTHDVHPLIAGAMTARETFGQYLRRRAV